MPERTPSGKIDGPLRENQMVSTVILTRAAGDNAALRLRLERAGARVLELPCVAVRPLADPAPLRRALRSLRAGDRLVLTSRAGAEAVAAALDGQAIGAPVAVIGATTHAAARRAGFEPDFASSAPDAETLARELPLPAGVTLLARSDRARPELPALLRSRGADVREVVAYHTEVATAADAAEVREALGAADSPGGTRDSPGGTPRPIVCLASPSAVDGFVAHVGEELARRARTVAIGPATAAHIRRRLGLEPHVAASPDPDGLARAIAERAGLGRPGRIGGPRGAIDGEVADASRC